MAGESVPIPQLRNLKERAFEEFKRFVAIFLYLWVVFGLLSLHKSLVLSQQHLDYEEHAFAIINAFVFAKVLLVGEEFHLGRRFQNRPLIYSILYKCLVFSVVLIFFHVIESVAVGIGVEIPSRRACHLCSDGTRRASWRWAFRVLYC